MKKLTVVCLTVIVGLLFISMSALAQESKFAIGINKKAKKVGWFNAPTSDRWDGSWDLSGDCEVTFDPSGQTWTMTIGSDQHIFSFYSYEPEESLEFEDVSVTRIAFSKSTIEAFFSDGSSETYREYLNVSPIKTSDGKLIVCLREFKRINNKWKMVDKRFYEFK